MEITHVAVEAQVTHRLPQAFDFKTRDLGVDVRVDRVPVHDRRDLIALIIIVEGAGVQDHRPAEQRVLGADFKRVHEFRVEADRNRQARRDARVEAARLVAAGIGRVHQRLVREGQVRGVVDVQAAGPLLEGHRLLHDRQVGGGEQLHRIADVPLAIDAVAQAEGDLQIVHRLVVDFAEGRVGAQTIIRPVVIVVGALGRALRRHAEVERIGAGACELQQFDRNGQAVRDHVVVGAGAEAREVHAAGEVQRALERGLSAQFLAELAVHTVADVQCAQGLGRADLRIVHSRAAGAVGDRRAEQARRRAGEGRQKSGDRSGARRSIEVRRRRRTAIVCFSEVQAPRIRRVAGDQDVVRQVPLSLQLVLVALAVEGRLETGAPLAPIGGR